MATPHGTGEGGGDALWFFGSLTIVVAEADAYAVTEQWFHGGVETPLHRHRADDETFHVLDGEATFVRGDERTTATAGVTVHVPAGQPHGFRVAPGGVRLLNVTTAQHLAFFRSVADPAAERTLPPPAPPDMERVMAAAGRYGVEVLGPLPA